VTDLQAADRIRVLVLSPIPVEGAGCRFRIGQFIPYLHGQGFDVTLSSLYTPEFFRLVYRPGHYARKAVGFARLALTRLTSLHEVNRFDLVFTYREIFPIGPAVIERFLTSPRRPPLVFDFDDAIFLPSVSDANRLIAALKFPAKVNSIIRRSAHVIAGNDFLASHARQRTDAVTVIPTCVDTSLFVPRAAAPADTEAQAAGRLPVIGWIGSPTTTGYIRALAPALRRVGARHQFVLRISGAGEALQMPGVRVDNVPWSLAREVDLFNACDIGVYPLADDEWSKGKCGLKAIAFMACGVPVIASAVGVNSQIIQDGASGLLATTEEDWVAKLELLLTDRHLRRRLATAGRRVVEERYSLTVNAPKLAATLRQVGRERPSRRRRAA